MARPGSAMRATATPRPGTCPPPTTSPPASPPRAPGTTSSAGKASAKFGVAWGPGFAIFQYPNDQRESTLWYHDHTLGMTRLNVYAGPAGFFLVRGGPEGDKAVLDSRTGTTAVLPSPAPNENDMFPPNKTYYEIPIAVQDRSFNTDGSLFYPDTRAFFDGYRRSLHPRDRCVADLEPGVLRQHDHGQRQHLAVPDRRAAPLPAAVPERLPVAVPDPGLQQHPRIEVWQIGNEGGFLAAPVNLTADQRQPAAAGPGRAGRPDRRLHQRAGRQLCPGQRGTGRAVRRREPAVDFDPPIPTAPARSAVPGRAGGGGRPDHPATVPGPAGHDPAHAVARPGGWPCWRRRRSSPTGRPRHGWASSTAVGTLVAEEVDGSGHREPQRSAPPRSGSTTTPPPTPTRCTSMRSPSKS